MSRIHQFQAHTAATRQSLPGEDTQHAAMMDGVIKLQPSLFFSVTRPGVEMVRRMYVTYGTKIATCGERRQSGAGTAYSFGDNLNAH